MWKWMKVSVALLAMFNNVLLAVDPDLITINYQDDTKKQLGIDKYPFSPALVTLSVAVLDNGFGPKDDLKRFLPEAELIDLSLKDGEGNKWPKEQRGNSLSTATHGRIMAQTFSTYSGITNVKLVNANGSTNLAHALDWCIAHGVKIILYAQSWEFGTNRDGTGFIDRLFQKALDAGIIVIAAAGNYEGKTYNGKVITRDDGWLQLKDEKNMCLKVKSNVDDNKVKIELTWNDFKSTETGGTNKDLDLYLFDEDMKHVIAASKKKQIPGNIPREKGSNQTYFADEAIEFDYQRTSQGPDDSVRTSTPSTESETALSSPAEEVPANKADVAESTPPAPTTTEALPAQKPEVAKTTPPPPGPGTETAKNATEAPAIVAPSGVAPAPDAPPATLIDDTKVSVKTVDEANAGTKTSTTDEKPFRLRKNTDKGFYYVCAYNNSKNFKSNDRITITVIETKEPVQRHRRSPKVPAVQFIDATKGKSIFAPADDPRVIAIGNTKDYSSVGPTFANLTKPDGILDIAETMTSDGYVTEGSSNSSAYFAAQVARMMSQRPDLTAIMLLDKLKKLREEPQNADGIKSISLADFSNASIDNRAALDIVTRNNGNQKPLLAGRYPDGRYVLATSVAPLDLGIGTDTLFPQPKESESGMNLRYFLKESQKDIAFDAAAGKFHGEIFFTGYTRKKVEDGDDVDTVPINDIEVRQARYGSVFVAPTPDELAKW